jgi:hypothetical protein
LSSINVIPEELLDDVPYSKHRATDNSKKRIEAGDETQQRINQTIGSDVPKIGGLQPSPEDEHQGRSKQHGTALGKGLDLQQPLGFFQERKGPQGPAAEIDQRRCDALGDAHNLRPERQLANCLTHGKLCLGEHQGQTRDQ